MESLLRQEGESKVWHGIHVFFHTHHSVGVFLALVGVILLAVAVVRTINQRSQ